ncbi:MAG: serine/threonine protein phosphatase [Alphaproteobacteria bacterium]|nr:serine/threonine protein phosphatase [Alphaproteobacteria bacterium]
MQHSYPRIPPGHRVYAIGDVHGRADLMVRLQDKIAKDLDRRPVTKATLVLLGDLIDRGPDSRGVVERAMAGLAGCQTVVLMGNHERLMLDSLAGGVGEEELWLMNGGDATLASYRVERAAALDRVLPAEHRNFLAGLALHHRAGDYVFVHAGLRPDRLLAEQDPHDLMWIREPFLLAKDLAEAAVVVHGHSVFPRVEFGRQRIGIDTGAYFSGRLSCLVLEEDRRFVLDTLTESPVSA